MTELLLLKIRAAIADKDWVIANANQELSRYGKWKSDWGSVIECVTTQIDALTAEAERESDYDPRD